MGNIVAIVGRPNVGKSTLFNRLTESRKAIVDEASGITRDRQYGKVQWGGREFSIVDTGGYASNTEDVFESEIRKQVLIAIEEADIILFMVDVTTGITDFDQDVAKMLRRIQKPVLIVANKVDNGNLSFQAQEFYGLGVGEVFSISSMSGSGTGDLLDEVVKHFKKDDTANETEIPKFAIVGRPNVGKSSLLNALVGEERNIVTPIAGTTRDTIYTRYTKFGFEFDLIDTAGLRKKSSTMDDVEFYSVLRSIRAIENSDVCILMLDAERGVEAQDLNIYHQIIKNRKGVVFVINKWDLLEKETNTSKSFQKVIEDKIAPFTDVPILFVSVLNKQRIHKVLETAVEVFHNRQRRIPTNKLNTVMLEAIEQFQPPTVKGKFVKIKYVTQLPNYAPSFAFFCNLPQYIKEPYQRYLENRLRENFNFKGVPMQLFFRKK